MRFKPAQYRDIDTLVNLIGVLLSFIQYRM